MHIDTVIRELQQAGVERVRVIGGRVRITMRYSDFERLKPQIVALKPAILAYARAHGVDVVPLHALASPGAETAPAPACAPEPPPLAARRAGQGRERRACDVELLPPRPTSAPRTGAQEPPGIDALLARLPEPTAADLRDAPVEWLEMVDWGYVARMARMKPAGWMHAIGVHLAIRRLYHWRDAIIAAAEAAG